eukprot:TRINITY_DN8091_c0_g1_i3.p1 TRINITY_DN8091_c0_g1~~TRINITY_DN8091_c0_g1_i3.p1  ORF type:complete len:296 (+),score=53.69 TRINITY_DN8091_c0_g1_i3:67-888(+)
MSQGACALLCRAGALREQSGAPGKGGGGLGLFIRGEDGALTPVELPSDALVQDLLEAARAATAGRVNALSFQGQKLDDPSVPLADLGIGSEAVLDSLCRLKWTWHDLKLNPGYDMLYTFSDDKRVATKSVQDGTYTCIKTTEAYLLSSVPVVFELTEVHPREDEVGGVGLSFERAGTDPWYYCALSCTGGALLTYLGKFYIHGRQQEVPAAIDKLKSGEVVAVFYHGTEGDVEFRLRGESYRFPWPEAREAFQEGKLWPSMAVRMNGNVVTLR